MADILNSSSSMIRTSSFRTPLRGQMETSNEEFSLLLNLPLEILVLVIERMSPVAFSNFRACNHSMRELADSCTPKYLEFEWNRIRHYTQQTLCIATELYNSRLPQVFEEHVCLLVQTLHELDQHVRVRLETELFVSDALAHLSHAFCSHIQTASIICTDILHHRKHFTVNFEMLDMSLRRSFKEIVAMFPILEIQQQVPIIPANTLILSRQPSSSYDIQPRSFYYRSQSQPVLPIPGSKSTTPSQKSQKSSISSDASSDMTPVKPPRRPASRQAKPLDPSQVLSKPTTLIRDLRARAAWESSFGQESLVFFSDFFEKLILTEWPQAATHPDFKIYFNFFLNFPRDQFMTTYKWDMITKQFGPYPQFFDNFTHYGCGNGFIGLVNSVKADEVLNNQVGSYVFRFSRKEPERLTLSYCTNSSGSPQVFHRRKPHDISLPKFLDAYLHSRNAISFHPAPCRLSPAGATVETLEEFVCSSEYFLTNMKQDSQETPDFFCSLKSKAISEASEFTHLV